MTNAPLLLQRQPPDEDLLYLQGQARESTLPAVVFHALLKAVGLGLRAGGK
jgi:hypothetical protein